MNCPNCGHSLAKGKREMVAKIQEGRELGLTLAQIAQALGVHSSTVEKYCSRFGIRKKSVTNLVESNAGLGHPPG